jgi:hypothetical protein
MSARREFSITRPRCSLPSEALGVSPGTVERPVVINSNLYLEQIFGKRPQRGAGSSAATVPKMRYGHNVATLPGRTLSAAIMAAVSRNLRQN